MECRTGLIGFHIGTDTHSWVGQAERLACRERKPNAFLRAEAHTHFQRADGREEKRGAREKQTAKVIRYNKERPNAAARKLFPPVRRCVASFR